MKNTTRAGGRPSNVRGPSNPSQAAQDGRAARILVGVLPTLILAACALNAHPSHPQATTAALDAAPPARFLLRPRAVDQGDRLAHTSASMSLREVQAYDSGCRMVEAPANVSIDALRDELGAAWDVEPNHVYRTAATPNDPLFAQDQAAVMNAIQAPQAWDLTTGSSSVMIAVLDTGADYNNPDLAGSLATKSHGNGKHNDHDADDIVAIDGIDGDGDVIDNNGHGTAVAGILGAQGNNGVGLAGVAWGSRIVVAKCFDDSGATDDDTLIRCYQAITQMKLSGKYNIRVANNSWGGEPSSGCLEQAITAAGNAGILSVFAAGNHAEGQDLDTTPEYPAAANLPSMITVASATLDGALSPDSNYGAGSVDLAAPGVNVTTLGLCPQGDRGCPALAQVSGTSFAAPFVSGAAALLFSQQPGLTPAQAKALLVSNVTPYPALAGVVRSGGLLNVYAALTNTPPTTVPVNPVTGPGTTGGSTGTPFADGTYTVDVAEFPTPPRDAPSIRPGVGYLFARTIEGVQEQRWLLQGWDNHPFLRPPRQSMGMMVHPALLNYTDATGHAAVVHDLASWIAFVQPKFATSGAAHSTYAKLTATAHPYDGEPLAPPFEYPRFLDPAPPATVALSQLDYFSAFPVLANDPASNAPVLAGFGFAVSDGPYQAREHWVLSQGVSGTVVVGSNGAPIGLPEFAGQMNAAPWQPGSTFVAASVRYYPYLAE
jgi:subtilisin family serine protease